MTLKKFVKKWQPVLNVTALEKVSDAPTNSISRHVNSEERPLLETAQAGVLKTLRKLRDDMTKTINQYPPFPKY